MWFMTVFIDKGLQKNNRTFKRNIHHAYGWLWKSCLMRQKVLFCCSKERKVFPLGTLLLHLVW
jgi:hypothetical protein